MLNAHFRASEKRESSILRSKGPISFSRPDSLPPSKKFHLYLFQPYQTAWTPSRPSKLTDGWTASEQKYPRNRKPILNSPLLHLIQPSEDSVSMSFQNHT